MFKMEQIYKSPYLKTQNWRAFNDLVLLKIDFCFVFYIICC